MRKTLLLIIICIVATLSTTSALNAQNKRKACERIKDGIIFNSEGEVLELGFDIRGYNYQDHTFIGGFCEAYNNAEWCQEKADVILYMKWNDSWLSNKDCDGDGALDRHYRYDSYIGSHARVINFQKGYYIDDNGKTQRWTYYVKIMAAPKHAYLENGNWYNKKKKLLGKEIWNEFYIKNEIYEDTGLPPANSLVQSLRAASVENKPVRYVDPFSVSFEQFTPME